MDSFAHLLWTFIIFYQPNLILLLLMGFFGVIPDLIPFGSYITYNILKWKSLPTFKKSENEQLKAPQFFFILYDISHSLIIFGICFTIVYIFLDKLALILLPWAMHIVFDIFSHSKPPNIFQTKFLYPISQFSIKGYSWLYRKAFLINYILIAIGIILRFFYIDCYIDLGV